MRYAAVVVEIGGTHKCLPLDNDVSLGTVSVLFGDDDRGRDLYCYREI